MSVAIISLLGSFGGAVAGSVAGEAVVVQNGLNVTYGIMAEDLGYIAGATIGALAGGIGGALTADHQYLKAIIKGENDYEK